VFIKLNYICVHYIEHAYHNRVSFRNYGNWINGYHL